MSAMYLQNKYTKWYNSIILKARDRTLLEYTERHHIIPRCLGGTNDKSNLVNLTAREHFICHWLLTKMVDNVELKNKLLHASWAMSTWHGDHQQRYKISSITYARLREKYAVLASIRQKGSKSPFKGRSHSQEAKNKVRVANTGKTHISPLKNKTYDEVYGNRSSLIRSKLKASANSDFVKTQKSIRHTGKKLSLVHKNKLITSRIGFKESAESIAKRSLAMKGIKKKTVACPHCQKIGGAGNMRRYHFEFCKQKSLNT